MEVSASADRDLVSQQQVEMLNSGLASLRVLGSPWDQDLRRFPVRLSSLSSATGTAQGHAATFDIGQPIHALRCVSAYVAASARAEVVGCSFDFQPGPVGLDSHFRIYSAVNCCDDNALVSADEYCATPSFLSQTTSSGASGGIAAPVGRALVCGEYGVSAQIKPIPAYGGRPRINISIRHTCGHAVAAAASRGDVFLYLVVRRYSS